MIPASKLFSLYESFVEIENYVIIDVDPETGEITEYEDHELSAESFLFELTTMSMLPSMMMPILRCTRNIGLESQEDGNEAEHVAAPKVDEETKRMGDEDEGHRAAQTKRELNWAGITRNSTVDVATAATHNPMTPDSLESNKSSYRMAEYSEPSDSARGEGSESPETDPDLRKISSSECLELLLGSGMVGLRVADSLLQVESEMATSVNGDILEIDQENEQESSDDSHEVEEKVEHGDEEPKKGNELEDGCEDSEQDARSHELRNLSLAASATAVMLAAIWMMERSYIE